MNRLVPATVVLSAICALARFAACLESKGYTVK
jgi:hypothetical protein